MHRFDLKIWMKLEVKQSILFKNVLMASFGTHVSLAYGWKTTTNVHIYKF